MIKYSNSVSGKLLIYSIWCLMLFFLSAASAVQAETLKKQVDLPKDKYSFSGNRAYLNLGGSDAVAYGYGSGISLMRIPLPPGASISVANFNGQAPWGKYKALWVESGSDAQAVLDANPTSGWSSSGTTSISVRIDHTAAQQANSNGEMWLFTSIPNQPGLTAVYILHALNATLTAQQINDWVSSGSAPPPPPPPVGDSPVITISNPGSTTDTTPTFSGTNANTTGNFTLSVGGSSYTVVPGSSSWNFTAPVALSVGSHTVTVSGSGTSANATVTITGPTQTQVDMSALQATLNSLVDKINHLCEVTQGVDAVCTIEPQQP